MGISSLMRMRTCTLTPVVAPVLSLGIGSKLSKGWETGEVFCTAEVIAFQDPFKSSSQKTTKNINSEKLRAYNFHAEYIFVGIIDQDVSKNPQTVWHCC